jgi:hypothetical protein
MASDEKKIEHRQPEAGDQAQAGKPITTPEDNARHERQQKLDVAKSFRLTTDKNNSFILDMGNGNQVKDNRPVSNQEKLSPFGKGEFRPENIARPTEFPIGPNSLPPGLRPTEGEPFRVPENVAWPTQFPIGPGGMAPEFRPENQSSPSNQSNQSDLPFQPAQPVSAEKLHELIEQIRHPNELPSASEVFAKMHDAVSISVDADGKMTVKEHVGNQPDNVVDYAQEKMIGGKTYYELQNGMQVVHQGDSVSIGEKPQTTDTLSAVLAALHVSEKPPDKKDTSDSSNSAVTNTERLWYGRPEQQGRQLADEILRGDFQAFNHDRNVEKFHFTPEQLKTLQETFQQVIAEQQFNAVHVLNCTPEEANQRLHNIGKAVKDGLINAEQVKGIKEKFDRLESNWNHITSE